jgi:inosine-uridine nucleoside N-ribohydrolase
MKKIPVIIDTDPGIDDALALLLVFSNPKKLDVKLITTAIGNNSIEKCTKNSLFLVENFAKTKIDVVKGMSKTLDKKEDKEDATSVHGASGLGIFKTPASKQKAVKKDVVEEIKKVLDRSNQKIVLIALGPLVNYANLLIKHPECIQKIDYIFSMGGSVDGVGNATPYAEFNVYYDPKALDIVLKSGVKLVISPLHLGQKTAVANEKFYSHKQENLKEKLIYEMIKGSYEPTQEGFFGLHDPQVIYGLLHPRLYQFKKCDVTVSLKKKTYGQTFMTLNKEGKYTVQLAKNYKKISKKMFKDFYK